MKLAFITDQFELRTPAQQLLDRFLIGYPDEGIFKKPQCEVTLVISEKNSEVERRMKDLGLVVQGDVPRADVALVFGNATPPRTVERCFVYGALPRSSPKNTIAGTATRGAFLLPPLVLVRNMNLSKALAIVQGPYPVGEIEALEALLPLIWERRGAEAKLQKVTPLGRDNFWPVLKRDFWPLVRSAISRSDTPQGDPVRDGRTQDLV